MNGFETLINQRWNTNDGITFTSLTLSEVERSGLDAIKNTANEMPSVPLNPPPMNPLTLQLILWLNEIPTPTPTEIPLHQIIRLAKEILVNPMNRHPLREPILVGRRVWEKEMYLHYQACCIPPDPLVCPFDGTPLPPLMPTNNMTSPPLVEQMIQWKETVFHTRAIPLLSLNDEDKLVNLSPTIGGVTPEQVKEGRKIEYLALAAIAKWREHQTRRQSLDAQYASDLKQLQITQATDSHQQFSLINRRFNELLVETGYTEARVKEFETQTTLNPLEKSLLHLYRFKRQLLSDSV